jgi:serine protease
LAIAVLLLLWLWATRGSDTPPAGPATTESPLLGPTVLSDQILVDLDNDATPEQVRQLEKRYRLRLRPNSRFSAAEQLFRSPLNKRDLAALLRQLRSEPAVERAELDAIVSIPPLEAEASRFSGEDSPGKKTFPNDPKYKYQWHLDQIQMPRVWPKADGRGVIVAVIDTGVAYKDRGRFKRVPDLAKTSFVDGYDFVNDHEHALDDHGHGTHVAGTIAQSTHNGVGVAGVAFRARIMPLKVLSSRGFGNVADIAEAIRFAADHGAKVINMSLGSNRSSRIMAAAVKYAKSKGVVIVCAAGNNGRGQVGYPAAYPEAIAVAATQYDRSTTFYSNWGKQIDLAAPGGNTRVDQNGDGLPDGVLQNTIVPGKPDKNDYLWFMGTSMASPHVAGAAALVIHSGVSGPDAVEKVLKSSAKHPEGKKWDPHYGAGIIDVSAALKKSTVDWSLLKLGLASLLGLGLAFQLRRRGLWALRPGPGMVIGLLAGSCGLFFLPLLGVDRVVPASMLQLLSNGFPAWDLPLLGPDGHANPLFHSLLAPLLLAVLLYGAARLRGLVFGFAVGVAGHLLYLAAGSGGVDVAWIPNVLALDQLWLITNGLLCLGLAHVVARR